jgi:cell division protein FtsQ
MRADTTPGPAETGEASVIPEASGRRHANRWKVLFVSFLVAGLLGAAAWVLLGSRLLVVRHVEVAGTHLLPNDRVVAIGRVHLGLPMIRLDTGAVRDRVEGIQQVESARVELHWPGTVRILVVERTPVVVVARAGRFDEMDRFGVTVLTVDTAPSGLPTLVVADPGPADPATGAALAAWRSLPDRLTRRLTAIEAPTVESITLRLSGGKSVVWGAPERAAEKIRLVDALLSTPAGRAARTIDVSSPEVVTTQ